MNRTTLWAFAVTATALAIADWSPRPATADDEAKPKGTIEANGVSIAAESREVEVDGKKESHLFLVASGTGHASAVVRLERSGGNPMSRVVVMDQVEWQRTETLSPAGKAAEIDLGALGAQPGGSRTLLASVECGPFVPLWSEARDWADVLREAQDASKNGAAVDE